MQDMAWCHGLGGTYSNTLSKLDFGREPYYKEDVRGQCAIPPPPASENCYTTEQDAPIGAPLGVNWYAYYLLDKNGAGAGGLDEYEHCAEFAVTRPRATEP